MRRRATIPVARTVPCQHLGVLIKIDEQRRRGDSVQPASCCRFSEEKYGSFTNVAAVVLQCETGEVHCQYSNTQIQILVALQVVVMTGLSVVSGPQLIGGEVTPDAFIDFSVFTITLLVSKAVVVFRC